MNSRNKLTMCRLCLCENECFVNIFEMNDWQGYVAAEAISNLLQFQVSEIDGYPHVVCSTCLVKLTDFKLFKECCHKSKVVYDNMFVSHHTLEGHQPEIVEFGIVKAEPMVYSDNEFDDSKVELVSVKKEPVDYLDNDGNVSKASNDPDVDEFKESPMEDIRGGGSGSELYEQDPLGDASSDEEGGMKTAPVKDVGERKGSFECRHCGKVLTTRQGLKGHLAGHGFGQSYKCGVCCKIFGSKGSLITHGRVHTGEKPYRCEKCYARFTQRSNLKYHIDNHCCEKEDVYAGEGPLQCIHCRKQFKRMLNLKRHLLVHKGDKSHLCIHCNKQFTRKAHLKRHLKLHTGYTPHLCIHCNKQFSRKEHLRRHLKNVCVGKS